MSAVPPSVFSMLLIRMTFQLVFFSASQEIMGWDLYRCSLLSCLFLNGLKRPYKRRWGVSLNTVEAPGLSYNPGLWREPRKGVDVTKAMENSHEQKRIFNSHSHILVLGQIGLQPLSGRELWPPVESVPGRKGGSGQDEAGGRSGHMVSQSFILIPGCKWSWKPFHPLIFSPCNELRKFKI